jgi:hypothetical protein
MDKIQFKKINKNIYVYKNLIPNVEDMVETLKNSEKYPEKSYLFGDWHPWSVFGTYILDINKTIFENYEGEKPELLVKEYEHYTNVINAFYQSTGHYLKDHKLEPGEDWKRMGPSFSRYYAHDNTDEPDAELSMVHHTDYVKLEKDIPGYKFALTCTMYLNDDYDGGGLSFLFGEKILDYKPKAGEIVVFPSGHPDVLSDEHTYYHSVKKVKNKDKFLIRCFYQIPYYGSEKWLRKQMEYGPFKWIEMEKERIKKNILSLDEIKENNNDKKVC